MLAEAVPRGVARVHLLPAHWPRARRCGRATTRAADRLAAACRRALRGRGHARQPPAPSGRPPTARRS